MAEMEQAAVDEKMADARRAIENGAREKGDSDHVYNCRHFIGHPPCVHDAAVRYIPGRSRNFQPIRHFKWFERQVWGVREIV